MYNLFPYAIIQRMKSNEWFHLDLLILTALIWGMAFVAQSIGANLVGPFTFLATRSWLGVLAIAPLFIHTLSKNPLRCPTNRHQIYHNRKIRIYHSLIHVNRTYLLGIYWPQTK